MEDGGVHAILIAGRSSDGLSRSVVSRHFDGSQRDTQIEWESKMFEAAMRDLDLLEEGSEEPMVCSIGERVINKAVSLLYGGLFPISTLQKLVAYSRTADLIIMVCGSGIIDELVLLQVLNALLGVLRLLMPKGGPSVSGVLDCYAKVVLAIDEMVCSGSIELLEPGKILQMSAFKWDKKNKEGKEERRSSTSRLSSS